MIDKIELKFLLEDQKNVHEKLRNIQASIHKTEALLNMNRGSREEESIKVCIDNKFINILEVIKLTEIKLKDDLLEWELEQFKKRDDLNLSAYL